MFIAMLVLLLNGSDMFVVEASAGTSYTVALSREALRTYVDDIGLFKRNMPGVVAVTAMGNGTYLYQTEKEVPLSSAMKTDFVIRKKTLGDSVTVYESVDPAGPNYMFCQVMIRPADSANTVIDIQLRLKLQRENGSDIHWMAPLLGAGFISRQMTKDMEEMLQVFVEKSNEELYTHLRRQATGE
jgi:carbon monoxide dehydrogenase subunit G